VLLFPAMKPVDKNPQVAAALAAAQEEKKDA
jgi:hypothetical protein